MLVQDKLSHLALSVPDISSHCFQQQQNQYNAVQHQAPVMGAWSTVSVPAHTVVQVIPGGTPSTKIDPCGMNGTALVPINNGHHTDGNASNSSGDPQTTGLVLPNHSKANGGWFNGLLGCLRPVWTIIGKATAHDLKHHSNQSSKFPIFLSLFCLPNTRFSKLMSFYRLSDRNIIKLYRRKLNTFSLVNINIFL